MATGKPKNTDQAGTSGFESPRLAADFRLLDQFVTAQAGQRQWRQEQGRTKHFGQEAVGPRGVLLTFR